MKWVAFVVLSLFLYVEATNFQPKLHIVTVATNEDNDGLKRLKHSAELYGHELHILGLDEEWKGGDMQNSQGGAQKIRILREGLSEFKEKNDAILMFVDAYDVIINADPDIILRRFLQEFPEYRVVFSAEPFCWPDKNLASKYPVITFGERYLNSGMFMGYAQDVLKILEHGKGLKDNDDDQRFYTSIYLNKELRDTYKISLDSLSRIFQNLNGLTEDVHIDYDLDGNAQVFNSLYNTHPVVIHGNGPSKVNLNQLGNYIAHGYNEKVGCLKCKPLIEIKPEEITLYIAIFISKPIPFVEEFLATFEKFEFPKENIHLLIYNNQPLNKITIKNFIDEKIGIYKSVTALNMKEGDDEHASRDYAIEWATKNNADFLLMLDADAHLTNPNSLQLLIRKALTYNTEILAPMIAQPKKLYTNFWGAVSSTGYYARSSDYLDIVENKLRGYWNAPFVSSAVLISKRKLPQLANAYSYNKEMDADMSFSLFCRNYGQFMYVDNLDEYGFLVPSDQFSQFLKEGYTNPEMYDYFDNHDLWEKRYIHPKYFHYIKPGVVVEQPCPDVYDFPFLSERFAKELIEVMEGNNHWSDGSHLDRRLEGGYENVPTRDIHMNQVNFDKQFLNIIDEYVAPMQEKVFTGFYQRPVKSNMMFVVRYKPEEQASLRPHHDASTYSIDVALNKRDVDYEGGGVRYIRYNCTVPADQIGWSMLFPGRLTHMHEGLLTTKGTRYILVSFINP